MESSLRSDISRIYGRIGNDFMNQNETQWDKLLKIKTTGRDDSRSDQHRYPYEPTQYCVLERLANNGLITKKNVLLDYGTGKGRVCFYLSYQTRCKAVGVEYDERIYKGAADNKELAKEKVINAYLQHYTEFDPDYAVIQIENALENGNIFTDCPDVIEVDEC